MKYTIRSSRKYEEGTEQVTQTDSVKHAVLLAEALASCRWYLVELEDSAGHVLWASYTKYMMPRELGRYMVANLSDVPGFTDD